MLGNRIWAQCRNYLVDRWCDDTNQSLHNRGNTVIWRFHLWYFQPLYGFQLNMICKCAYYFMLISRHRGMKEARSLVTALQIVLLHSRHQCHNTEKYYHAEQKIQCCKILSRQTKEDLIFYVSTCSFRSICAVNRCSIWQSALLIPYSKKIIQYIDFETGFDLIFKISYARVQFYNLA